MSPILLVIAGASYALLGVLHGVLTLRDVVTPTSFTPTDPSVREAMQGARLAFNRRINLWDAWLGFNLSHSVGLIVFGGVLLAAGQELHPQFAASRGFQGAVLLVAASYVGMAFRFWFWAPAMGTSFALLCIAGAILGL